MERVRYLGGHLVHGLLVNTDWTGDVWYTTLCGKDAGTARSRICTADITCPKCEVLA
jgi:hypothetical protein